MLECEMLSIFVFQKLYEQMQLAAELTQKGMDNSSSVKQEVVYNILNATSNLLLIFLEEEVFKLGLMQQIFNLLNLTTFVYLKCNKCSLCYYKVMQDFDKLRAKNLVKKWTHCPNTAFEMKPSE